MEMTGIDKPRYPDSDFWEVRGYAIALPPGYLPPEGVGEVVKVCYEPSNKTGSVKFKIVCPHCLEDLYGVEMDDISRSLNCHTHGLQVIAQYNGQWQWMAHPTLLGGALVGGEAQPGPITIPH